MEGLIIEWWCSNSDSATDNHKYFFTLDEQLNESLVYFSLLLQNFNSKPTNIAGNVKI